MASQWPVAAGVALDPAAHVDVDGADNKTDSTGVVDVAIVMIDDVTIGSVNAAIIVAKNWKCGAKRNEPNLTETAHAKNKLARYQRYLYRCLFETSVYWPSK